MKRLLLALIFSLALTPAWADAVQVDFLLGSFLDNNAAQLAGGYVYTYAAGTTTSKATYLDAAKTQVAANPVVLDTYGRANVYADGLYKFIIKDADGVTIATYDNLEFVSAVNPTSIVTTDLTVSSLTATLVDIKAGTIATATMDSSLITNSRISNAAILAAPTLASHPVNLSYFTTQTASQANYEAATLASHTGDSTDPHGATLYQSELVTALISYAGGNIIPGATGTTIIGALADTCLTFLATGTTVPDYQIRYDSTTGYLDLEVLLATKTIRIDPYSAGSIDFDGMTLTNYTPPANFVIDTATGAVLIPAFGGGSVTIASYTLSGISSAAYVVNWGAEIYHSATNAATIEYSLNVNGASVQTRRTSVADDANFMVDPEWTYQGPLKAGDYITITLSCYSSVAAGAHGTYCGRYYIQGHVR